MPMRASWISRKASLSTSERLGDLGSLKRSMIGIGEAREMRVANVQTKFAPSPTPDGGGGVVMHHDHERDATYSAGKSSLLRAS